MADPDSQGQRQSLSHLPSNESAASQITTPTSGHSSFDCFARLPQELQSQIIALACSLPPLSPDSDTPALDVSTARCLSLTSRGFHAHANPLLWGTIRILRPRALLDLSIAIDSCQELAAKISSLHVGPEEEASSADGPNWRQEAVVPPGGVWRPPIIMMTASLSYAGRVKLEPTWNAAEKEWRLNVTYKRACLSAAVSGALLSIQRVLDVDLTGRDTSRPRSIARLYEAQAALDVYLIEAVLRDLRAQVQFSRASREERQNARKGCSDHIECPEYPTLVLVERSTRQTRPKIGQAVVRLNRQALQDQIDQPGSQHDRFDHPVQFARAGFNPQYISVSAEVTSRWQPDEPYGPEDIFDSHEWRLTVDEDWKWVRNTAFLYKKGPKEVGEMFRWLLLQVPNLQNLSLSCYFAEGFLVQTNPPLLHLQSLTLGPPSRLRSWWKLPLLFNSTSQLTSLHICGLIPRAQDVVRLGLLLQRLQELRWTLSDQLTDREVL